MPGTTRRMPISRDSLVSAMLRELSAAFRAPAFRETFASEVVQPLAHSAFGVPLRHVAYAAVSAAASIALLLLALCVLVGLTFARLAEVLATCAEVRRHCAPLFAGS